MKHSHTARGLRTSARVILAISAFGLATACADSISAPSTEVSVRVPAGFNKSVGVVAFKYDPSKKLDQKIAGHRLKIPAGGVCDPTTSKYGAAYWDAPCDPLTKPIIITATVYQNARGHSYIDFQPALRFVPTKVTSLTFLDGRGSRNATAVIFYCNALAVCVDESKTDNSLVTKRDGRSGIVWRRLKHFSGYNVAAGRECTEEDAAEDCVDYDPDTMPQGPGNGRSGYMVASGLTKKGSGSTVVGKKITADNKK